MAKTARGGQPPAFYSLAATSLGTGFATYGVSAILILYLYAAPTAGLGCDRVAATQILAVFATVGFIAGTAGSFAADRLVGMRKLVLAGNLIKAVGIAWLAVPGGGFAALWGSLALQVVGSGVCGQSLNALAGALYDRDSPRRAAAFSLLYITANIGAAAPLLTGAVALRFGYHVGFAVAAAVLVLSLVPYWWGQQRWFGSIGLAPVDPLPPVARRRLLAGAAATLAVLGSLAAVAGWRRWLSVAGVTAVIGWFSLALPVAYAAVMVSSAKTSANEARRVRYFVVFMIGNAISIAVYGQATGILALYAADSVRLTYFGLHLTPAGFQTVPAVFAILFGAAASFAWTRLGRRQPSDTVKFGLGMVLWGLGPLFMAVPLAIFPAGVRVSPLWLVGFYALITLGEALTSPIGTALATRIAPLAFTTQLVTVYALSQAGGNGLAALLVTLYRPGHEAAYFAVLGSVTVLFGLGMLAWRKPLAAGVTSGLSRRSS
ncbi:peptide MFS transporter [Lacticaseibacillus parakribbianus]|uniref:peptide MFS transporter n=1 Tax=Lacticaseibacillus parakribbianus TaxID=2970927 RepID=UPI0021CB16C2